MEESLTVSAIGTDTVAPDEAYVTVVLEMDYGPFGAVQLSVEDRHDILANLVAIRLTEEVIQFEQQYR